MNPVFLPWLVAVGLISADDLVTRRRAPVPARFFASFVIFGGLAALAESPLRPAAVATAVGLDIAMLIALVSSNQNVLTSVGAFLGGNPLKPSDIGGPALTLPLTAQPQRSS